MKMTCKKQFTSENFAMTVFLKAISFQTALFKEKMALFTLHDYKTQTNQYALKITALTIYKIKVPVD